MKRIILFVSVGLLLVVPAFADTKCFLAIENNQIIKQEGDCKLRQAPCSTFKIAISLMGYNEGILTDETHPEFPFKENYVDWLDVWRYPHNPMTWLKNSCVWYSQVVTRKLGMEKFSDYVTKFSYGNQDVSGDKGQNNGITNAWLSSSLQISPEEQAVFLQKLLDNKLPVSHKSHEMTRNILFVEDLLGGWKLYGKTGNGFVLNHDRTQKLDRQIGWFIGWIQKANHTIVFVHYIEDGNKQDTYASIRSKAAAKEKLTQIIQSYNSKNK